MKALLEKIAKILKNRRTRKIWYRIISGFAAFVIFVTTYALVLPAITLESNAAMCGIEAHQHTDDCYEERLVCGQEESEGHQHDDDCYSVSKKLVCDNEEHRHDDSCYDQDGNLVCGEKEHTHSDDCYQEVRELTCDIEESKGHHHDSSCYEKVLACGKEAHTHSEKCYEKVGEDAAKAGAAEKADEAKTDAPEKSEETLPENASGTTVAQLDPVNMEAMLNKHTDMYYFHAEDGEEIPANSMEIKEWQKVKDNTELVSDDLVRLYLAYTIPVGSLNETNPVARYRLPENVKLTDKQIKAINENENGIAAAYNKSSAEYKMYLGAEAVEGDRRPGEMLKDGEQEFVSAVVKAEKVYEDDKYIGQDLIFTFVPYTVEKNQNAYDADGNTVKVGQKITGWFACDLKLSQIEWTEDESSSNAGDVAATEETGRRTVEKTAEIIFAAEDKKEDIEEINRTLKLVEQDEKGAQKKEQEREPEKEYQSGTLTSDGDGYTVTMDYTADAKIPDNARLSVREITAETDRDSYEEYLAQAEQHVAESGEDKANVDKEATRFFDIEILVDDDEGNTVKIEPAAAVNVRIQMDDAPIASDDGKQSDPTVLHFAKEGVETIDSTAGEAAKDDNIAKTGNTNKKETSKSSGTTAETGDATEIRFEAESFSVYGVVYTVDFHYEVNGKLYDFSIPGGGFISFAHLVEVLGIGEGSSDADPEDKETSESAETDEDEPADNSGEDQELFSAYEETIKLNETKVSEATKQFVADVVSVEFSSPELVWVGKVLEAAAIGELKDANELAVEYSEDLTQEQIAQINAQTVEAGDWALISLQPFTSDETLTVTMKNGDQFTVKVTDAQKPYTDVSQLENGTYIIYRSDNSGAKQLFLKNDGTSTVLNPQTNPVTSDQFSNYTWEVTKTGNTYTIRSTSNTSRYINLYGNNGEYDNWSSIINWWESAPTVILSNGSKGIKISQGSKVLARNTSNGFYNSTDSSKAAELIFFKIEDDSSGSSGIPGIILTDEERAEYEKWKQTIEKWNTLTDYDKTAEVYDADNRIYKIDLQADSGITDFYQDVDLGFVLDVSMSMKFPASLRALENNGEELKSWISARDLDNARSSHASEYNKEGCFYVISDPAVTSTIYKVYKDGNTWRYHDASLTATEASDDGKLYTVSDTTVLPKDSFRMKYTLYYADDVNGWTRFQYLDSSVDYTIETLKQIVRVTPGDQLDNTAAVRVAYNLFCKEITASDTFRDLRLQSVHDSWDIPLVVANMGSGTQQNRALYDPTGGTYERQSANEFGWDNDNQQYVILVTDGAPNGPSIQDVKDAARNLKIQYPNIKIFTIGLSTKDVDGGSEMLYEIADEIGGQKQFYEAEKAQDLEYILLKILRTIMAKGLVRGKITDTIDSAFYPVDSAGNPLSAGVYNSFGKIDGASISDYVVNGKPAAAHTEDVFYTWEQVGDEWKITWYNQSIGWDDNDATTGEPWTGTVYVKAKEDYLGGNLIATNDGNAQVEPTGIKLVIDGEAEDHWRPLDGMTPVDLPVPRVNVHNLESKGNSTTWTVYKDTTVTPADQIRALWNSIPIEEVVSSTDGGNHKVTTGASANVGTSGTGETFKLADLLTEFSCKTANGAAFNIDTLINSLGNGANASVSSDPIIYNAYGHESGTITATLKREAGNAALTQHNADTVGTPAEKYSLTVTYQPYSESVREEKIVTNQESGYTDNTDYHNGSAGRGTEETGTITSNNTHTINVFQKGIKVTKVDKTNPATVLPGAVFELYRVDAAGSADVSAYNLPSDTSFSKVGSDLTADANGVITINPAIPDNDSAVTGKTLYEPNISVGATDNTSYFAA